VYKKLLPHLIAAALAIRVGRMQAEHDASAIVDSGMPMPSGAINDAHDVHIVDSMEIHDLLFWPARPCTLLQAREALAQRTEGK
jgi:hypothetical protein